LPTSSPITYTRAPVSIRITCDSCGSALQFLCEGVAGVAGYDTYNEYVCPACDKLGRARTPGPITSVRRA